jgi:hypothetical protein
LASALAIEKAAQKSDREKRQRKATEKSDREKRQRKATEKSDREKRQRKASGLRRRETGSGGRPELQGKRKRRPDNLGSPFEVRNG